MLSLRGLWFVCASALLLATSARAGLVEPPFTDTDVCGVGTVAGTLVPTNTFAGSARCASHCRKAASECRNIVRRVGACYVRLYGANASFAIKNCAETTATRAEQLACKAPLVELLDLIKASLKANVADAVADCEDWGDACELQCVL